MKKIPLIILLILLNLILIFPGCSDKKEKPVIEPSKTSNDVRIALSYFEAANDAQSRRDLISAEKLIKKAIEINPENEDYHFALGHIYDEQYKLNEAASEFRTAIKINPDSARSHEAFGMILFEQDKSTEAEEEMNKVLKIDPEYARAYETLGNLAIKKGNDLAAEKYLQKAILHDPDLVDAYIRLGTLYVNRKDFSKGKTILEKALIANERLLKKGTAGGHGEESHIRIVLGQLYFEKGEAQKAYNEFRKALDITPDLIGAFTGLAETSYKLGRPGESLAWIKRAKNLHSFEKRPYLLETRIYLDNNRPQRALEALEKIKKIHPEQSDQTTELEMATLSGETYLALNKNKDAEKFFTEALSIDPESGNAHYGLARILARKNKLKESISELKYAIEEEESYLEKTGKEKDFQKLRGAEEFKKLMKEMKRESNPKT